MSDATLLHDALSQAAATSGDRIAIRAAGDTWTYADLEGWSQGFSAHLLSRGVRPGERVAVRLANRAELVSVVLAITRIGASAVLVSPAWQATEIDHAVAITAPVHVVVDDLDQGVLAARVGGGAVTDIDESVAGSGSVPLPEVVPSADAVLVFSSGTTGMPKAVRHTHASLRAATRHWVDALGLGPDDRFQISTPPSHILGLLNLLASIDARSTVRLHRRFDLDTELRSIAEDRMTLEMAVAPIMLAIANHPDLESYDLSSLRYIMWGATPVTVSVAERVAERTGVPTLAAYGASEVPVLTSNPVADPAAWRLDSPGVPAVGVHLRVIDLDDGSLLAPGSIGEIQARGPSTMAGLLPDEATAEAFDDGWYRTGDVGWIGEDGWVHLTDRSKEMIKVSGFQVAPAEIESVLLGHPAVVDCAVFGIPDHRTGEAPVAAVQLDPAVPGVTPDELAAVVASTLATYKRLAAVVVVESVPRLPSGKALRRELRAQWLAGRGSRR